MPVKDQTGNLTSIISSSRSEKYYADIVRISWLSTDITILKFSALKGSFISNDHHHNNKEICYIASGSGFMKVDGTKSFPLKKGSLFYLNQGVHHHLVSNLDDQMEAFLVPFTYTPIVFSDKIPPQWAEDERKLLTYLDNNRYLQAEDEFGCGSELQNLIEFTKVSNRGEYIKIKNYISNFMVSALQAFAGKPQRLDFMNILENSPTFQAADKYMRKHYTENISLQSMAEDLHYSPRQCQRLLYDSMGMSFSELLLDMRMTHAKELLRSTDETMEEIAEHSGFRSGKAFTRQFKEKEGITPSAYRKSFQGPPSPQSD